MHVINYVTAAVVACGMMAGTDRLASADDGRIRPYEANPFYWQYKGSPVLLLGGTVEDNLFQIPDLVEHLDLLKSVGGNYVRNTMSSRDPGDVWPFKPVDGKYDLDDWNAEYWRRFETFLAETAKRDVIVQIEVWATFDYYRDVWFDQNPFAPKNNVNYSTAESGLRNRVNSHPLRLENPFFFSVPEQKDLANVRRYQERFVARLLESSLKYDHVLYCMDNETAASPDWSNYWVKFIRKRAAEAGKTVETTEMRDGWDVTGGHHNLMFEHPELYTFLDVSQNNHQKGQRHYDNPLKRRAEIRDQPRPINNVKIYGADGGRFGNTRDGVERFWRNVFGGLASARFHRPDSGLGLNETAQRNIQGARQVTAAVDLFRCEPRPDLLIDCRGNEAYCLANEGVEYAVYFPASGDVTMRLVPAAKRASLRWYAIDQVRWSDPEMIDVAGSLRLVTPSGGSWAAVVRIGE